eukprot:PhF_6_TR43648/c3_g1_i1/m.67071
MTFRVVLLTVALLFGGAQAWWCTGHMLTGQIAQILAPQAAAYFQPDIDYWAQKYQNIATLPQAACWADDFRSQNHSCDTWHYHDGCYSSDGTSCPSTTDGLLLEILPKTIEVLTDSSASQDDRSFYFMFLIHLVGDLHQPLHTAAEFSSQFPSGDKGGNLFHVVYKSTRNQVLHAFCDAVGMLYKTDPPRPFSSHPSSQTFIENTAQALIGNYSFPSSATTFYGNFSTWADQSFGSAVKNVYLNGALRTGETLSNTYIDNIRYVLQGQVALGGARLASVLNYVYSQTRGRRPSK